MASRYPPRAWIEFTGRLTTFQPILGWQVKRRGFPTHLHLWHRPQWSKFCWFEWMSRGNHRSITWSWSPEFRFGVHGCASTSIPSVVITVTRMNHHLVPSHRLWTRICWIPPTQEKKIQLWHNNTKERVWGIKRGRTMIMRHELSSLLRCQI